MGWAEVIDIGRNHFYNIKQPEDSKKLKRILTSQNTVPQSSVMFRRDAVQSAGAIGRAGWT